MSASQPSADFLALQHALAGRYSLIRELGRGGMGIVYLAQEVQLDRPVALKVLPPRLAARDELRDRFLREARTAARLSHPHIVPIHAVHEVGGFVFFAMAFIEGETLGERIREKGPLAPREAARILREVGWALAYAHAQGIVHRDVKPDNILLEGSTGRALVTDFGIAQTGLIADGGGMMGTAEFMSPEQAAGAPVDERSDLYALGVVGYYMLSGRLPLQGRNAAATLAKQLTQSPPPLSSVAPGLPAPLTQAVDRCLAKAPADRFATGEELAGALAGSLDERREVPFALRFFMKQNRDATVPLVATEAFSLTALTVWGSLFALGILDFELGPLLVPVGVWLGLAATPVALLTQMARRLLRSGHDHGDLLRAMRDDLEERRGDLASTYGSELRPPDRWLNRLLAGGLGVHVAVLGWMALGPYVPVVATLMGPVLGASLLTWVGAGSVAAVRHQLRGRVHGQGWLRFWESPLGSALFRAAEVRLDPPIAGAPYGPTELSIGIAADRLYQALPTRQREAFQELPEVVRRLEADATRMRAHRKELDALILAVEEGAASSSAMGASGERGDSLAGELKRTRTAAETRLRDVVAALETIRIELLRLHAGTASIESVTMDLSAAQELSEDVVRMREARREVERFLGRPSAAELAATPTPA
jgi:eukaryotic-like serine/threonine-protein kinase